MYNYIIIIVILFLIDIFSKELIEKEKFKKSMVIIPKVLEIKYIRNYGAAYGIFQNSPIFLKYLNTILIIFVMYLFTISTEKVDTLAYSFILAGGMGNHYNRILKKYVVDFIYIPIKYAPIFNFADIFILTGIIIYI